MSRIVKFTCIDDIDIAPSYEVRVTLGEHASIDEFYPVFIAFLKAMQYSTEALEAVLVEGMDWDEAEDRVNRMFHSCCGRCKGEAISVDLGESE